MAAPGSLTTTSYAILGLLAIKPWSTYELAKQVERSLNNYWPRAESKLYEEPKKLAALGLATVRHEQVGQRTRAVYAITGEGRRALEDWVRAVGSPAPALEFEAMVRVCFAENGGRDDLLRLLAAIRDHAETWLAYGAERAGEYRATGGPFPARLPVIALVSRFLYDYHRMIADWARWAESEVVTWPERIAEVDPAAIVAVVFDPAAIRPGGDRG